MTAAVCCGTCRYFAPYRAMTRVGVGECHAPLPDSVDEESRTDMPSNCGIKCDAWESDDVCPFCGRDVAVDPRRCEKCREVL